MSQIDRLIDALAEWDGRGPEAFSNIAGLIGEKGNKPSAIATNLLIAANVPYPSDRAAIGLPIYWTLKRDFADRNPPLPDAFKAVDTAETFGEAIEALIENAVAIRQWFVEGCKSPSDATEYLVWRMNALRVILDMSPLPWARISICRESNEPTYTLFYKPTDKIVDQAPNEPYPDRRAQNSIGLPTILSLAGAILEKNLFEEDSEDSDVG